jgi:hypothetical protein
MSTLIKIITTTIKKILRGGTIELHLRLGKFCETLKWSYNPATACYGNDGAQKRRLHSSSRTKALSHWNLANFQGN